MSVQSHTPDHPDHPDPDHPERPERPERRWPERMPTTVKWLTGLLWFQAVFNALGTVALFLRAQDLTDHGEEGGGSLVGVGVISLVVVALLAASAIAAVRGRSWGWTLTLVLEIIAILSGLAMISEQNSAGVIGIGFAGALMSLLCAPQTRQWYGRR